MKVLNLRCGGDHRFEGWFASDEDFAAQAAGSMRVSASRSSQFDSERIVAGAMSRGAA